LVGVEMVNARADLAIYQLASRAPIPPATLEAIAADRSRLS